MRYLSLFSGIEAATCAWEPLGWTPVAFAEIEPFPCKVLAHHYPNVPNLGDVTKITEFEVSMLGRIDIVIFGSPCQDLSVAGKRKGLAGERSGLFHDAMRIVRWAREHCGLRFALWENVPGAFSSNKGADFAVVVGEMAGCDEHPAVPPKGWGNEGAFVGEEAMVEWSTLDAQWFGVAQRRRRVFALADFGDWTNRPPVLLEPDSMRGDTAPRREARQGLARAAASGAAGHGGHGLLGVTPPAVPPLANCLTAGGNQRYDFETETLLPMTIQGDDVAPTLDAQMDRKWGSNQWVRNGQGVLAFKPGQSEAAGGTFVTEKYAPTLQAQNNGSTAVPAIAYMPARTFGADGGIDEFFAEREISDCLHTGSGSGNKAPLIAFSAKDYGADASSEVAPTMRAMNHTDSHANGGGQIAVAFDLLGTPAVEVAKETHVHTPLRCRVPGQVENSTVTTIVGFHHNAQAAQLPSSARDTSVSDSLTCSQQAAGSFGVRRLTPRECERLQGFKDDYTRIPGAADGPRYKALGNSMAVPVINWIGRSLEAAVSEFWA